MFCRRWKLWALRRHNRNAGQVIVLIWSFVKIGFFLVLATALAFAVGHIVDTGGAVTVAFGDNEISVTPIMALLLFILGVIAALVLLKVIGLLVAVMRFVLGDNTAISRYFDRNRERRGFDALGESIIALAAGDGRKAMSKATRAETLLQRPELTQLINAQAAELTGDRARAQEHFKALLKNDRTRFVGVKGLLQQKLDQGDTETALKLAQKAFAINPSHDPTLATLFDLQSEEKDWDGAKETLRARVKTRALTKDVGKRRDAVLTLAGALKSAADGDDTAREAALKANKIAPGLIPAAVLAARLLIEKGETRRATNVIKKAWTQNPHPELAAAFAEIAPDETPQARLKRFKALLKLSPDATEAKLLEAELHLSAEDFPAARKALGDLAESDPTARSLSIMAAIERGSGADEAVVSGWLARALAAPRGDAWICTNCRHIHGAWDPACENCASFDTLAWSRAPASQDPQAMAAAMLPLLMTPPQITDAETDDSAADDDDAANGADAEDPAAATSEDPAGAAPDDTVDDAEPADAAAGDDAKATQPAQ